MNATLLLLILSSCHAAYYLPGVTPHTFQDEETVSVLFPVSDNVLFSNIFCLKGNIESKQSYDHQVPPTV